MYSVNNGLDWTGIVSGTPDDGIHPWTVPDTVSDSCLISVSDTNGSISDTSDAVFTILSLPPQIASVNPVQNALNISKNTNISVTFDQDMNPSTINDSTFIVHSFQTGLHTGTYSYDTVTNTATFDPDINFTVGEIVSVFLTTDIEDVTDDTLTNPYAWSFTIEVDGGTGKFAPKVDYGAGYWPLSVFSSDLDGDGDMDLAVANWGFDGISVLLNNGDGTFAAKVDYLAGSQTGSVFSSDLDGDGDMDLAVANCSSDNVSVLLNIGPHITITSPNGGEEWVVDSTYNITWTSAGTSGNVHIEFFSADTGFAVWADVIASTPDDGSYSWTIPNTPSDSCLVRITDTDGSPSDTSDAKFWIVLASGISDELPDAYSFDLRGIAINNRLEVRYALPEKASIVKFIIYDVAGKKVKEEKTNESPAGFYSKDINIDGVSKGVYFIRMEANGKKFVKTSKFVLM